MKKIPQRTCMGCNTKKDKNDLIRIESTPPVDDDGVFLNPDFFWDHPETAELYTAFYKDIFKIYFT